MDYSVGCIEVSPRIASLSEGVGVMSRRIMISSVFNQILVGIVEQGRLAEFFLEQNEQSRLVGNIYKGKVENVLPGMDAAFVNIGLERNAFLYVDDISSDDKSRPIQSLVHKGQEILVQVTKEPEGNKGARVIGQITIPGRSLVLMPSEDNIGVSRQISDTSERDRLKRMGRELKPEGIGLIIRTVAEGKDYQDLLADREYLLSQWANIQEECRKTAAPALVYQDHDLVYRIVRDIVSADVEEIVVDSLELYQSILDILDQLGIDETTKINLYTGKVGLFEQAGITKDLDRATKKRVWLNSGGYLIIDQTEALVSIDVNTGKYVGSTDLADTVLSTNLEASREIAKQLRLRNIGGIIIIDFIDMVSEVDKQKVLAELEQALAKDKTKSHVLGFTQLGLAEMTRKKSKKTLSHVLEMPCPSCQGTGHVLSPHTVAINTAQQLYALAKENDVTRIEGECHPQVAALLIGKGGSTLAQLRKDLGVPINISGNEDYTIEETKLVPYI